MVQIGFKCNRGIVRENNEDACFVIPSHDVYIVADGVGGNNSGEVASRTAVADIAEYVNSNDITSCQGDDEIFGFIIEAIDLANSDIYKMGYEKEHRGMATTLVMAYISKETAYIANIGDSRAYVFRNGKLNQITKDHTYVNELISQGAITEAEAENHEKKNVITRALGAERFVEADLYKLGLVKDDVILLCSDGLYGEVPDEVTELIIGGGFGMNETCSRLVEAALKNGGRDNITVVCIKI